MILIPKNDTDEADQTIFFELVYNRFLLAEERAGENKYTINLAGHPIQLRFAGPAMIPHLLPALEHLIIESDNHPELRICIWDCESTGTNMFRLVSHQISYCQITPYSALNPRREIIGFSNKRFFTYFIPGPAIISLMDSVRNLAIYWIDDAQKMPYYEKGNPFKPILNWWMESTELVMLHAAGVGNSEGGVLIPGKSESGKSTTALACLDSGLGYLSDDTCAVRMGSQPYAFSLFNSGRLNGEEDIKRLPHLVPLISNPVREEGEKALVFIHHHQPESLINNFPVKAILVPRLTEEKITRVFPAAAREALMAIAPSSILQLPGAGKRNLQLMARIIKQLPCFYLNLGRNITSIPEAITDLLNDLQHRSI